MADSVNENYKKLPCYKKMQSDNKKAFDSLAAYYGTLLNKGPDRGITLYTTHDFDHHCFDLYRIISLYLVGDAGLEQLNSEELYLLNLSVLLHDISMCKGGYEKGKPTAFNRDIHSLQSEQWIRHEYSTEKSHLNEHGLSKTQIDMICMICKAHSDLKGHKDGPGGLSDPNLPYKKTGTTEEIRVKALAGILRMADELDVTSDRLINSDKTDSLILDAGNDKRPEVQQFAASDKESIKHFQRLKLVDELEKRDTSTLVLMLNSDQAQKRIDEGDELNLTDDLAAIREKIQNELDSLWTKVLDQSEACAERLITLRSIGWGCTDHSLLERLFPPKAQYENLTPATSEAVSAPPKNITEELEKIKGIKVLNPDLSQELREHVLSQNILSVGHYQLNGIYCARDWISTADVLNSPDLSAKIVNAFSRHILDSFPKENFIVVGLDLAGAQIAAQLGFALQRPFTYVIPAHQYSQVDPHEVHVPGIAKEEKIILVTDCIITGLTISEIIRENEWEEQIAAIYTVFYRKPQAQDVKASQLPGTIHTLNQDFPAEIALVANCLYGKNGKNCKALNRKL